MSRRFSLVLLAFGACAHTTPSPAEPPPAPASKCAPVDAVRATRGPKPTPGADCSAERAAMEAGCNANDALACHRTGVCITQAWGLRKPEEPGRAEAFKTDIDALGRACRAGLSESCVLRAGLRIEFAKEPEAATCDDMVRACQLGDEADGCLACLKAGCS
ncbi:MAG: hypothetical protein SFW67_19285 [Myxococcaceae bacterium]|nr:hypothetical protein [Myxococcaceae bacterium]